MKNEIIIPNIEVIAILAVLFLILGFLSLFVKRAKRKHRYNRKKSLQILKKISTFEHDGQRLNYLRKINPFVFEELLLDAFKNNGYAVKRNDRYTGDNGIDGVVFKDNTKFIVQAKRYTKHINLKHLKDFHQLTVQMKCKGFFVHTGRTGKGSREQEKLMSGVSIVSGSKLLKLIRTLEIDNEK